MLDDRPNRSDATTAQRVGPAAALPAHRRGAVSAPHSAGRQRAHRRSRTRRAAVDRHGIRAPFVQMVFHSRRPPAVLQPVSRVRQSGQSVKRVRGTGAECTRRPMGRSVRCVLLAASARYKYTFTSPATQQQLHLYDLHPKASQTRNTSLCSNR